MNSLHLAGQKLLPALAVAMGDRTAPSRTAEQVHTEVVLAGPCDYDVSSLAILNIHAQGNCSGSLHPSG